MNVSTRPTRLLAAAIAVLAVPAAVLAAPTNAIADKPPDKHTTVEVYDSFQKPGGYTLADYAAKWATIYGPGEMANDDTRSFAGNSFHVSAVPFTQAADFSVFDHLKYIAVSTKSWPVPARGSVEFGSTIRAVTPGTEPGRVVHGTYTLSGAPYAAATLEGQQAGAVMNVIDFSTGQLFDWFVSGSTAFALIERLPSTVTGNTTDPDSPEYVGLDQAYTQIIREIPASSGPHEVTIRYSRADGGTADYSFDGRPVAHVEDVGVPLDVQGQDYTGIYPSLGAGEVLGDQIDSLVIGHGLFSLLDAFPFQHPEAPELAVSIPLSERLFGQGADATFDDFRVKTVTTR
ncbi:DUF6081 family protein [Nocardioides rubriscoriae]|uniref:DUF6081 family protein n=1 Tax=Nocardioides rubriscoriae TaxID=642762 RepID=UPI0011E0062C|nr:DUF6081 family protein [Nocardioides rubriscoriae]